MAHTKQGSVISCFKVGDKVRVKPAMSDPDFPDMPLGGWSGTVTEIIEQESQINCVFKLDDRTLASIHPIYRRRCERDGLDFETMGLGEEDLELDDGTPVPIEQQLRAYPYKEHKVGLTVESQAVLDVEYEKALAEDKVLVLAWDSATGRLVTATFDHN